jgi:hypothetical protein
MKLLDRMIPPTVRAMAVLSMIATVCFIAVKDENFRPAFEKIAYAVLTGYFALARSDVRKSDIEGD